MILLLSGCAAIQSKEATVGCQAADAATTLAAIHTGLAKEGNPIVAHILSSPLGAPGFILAKGLLALGLLKLREEPNGKEVVGLANGITCGAAALNMRFLK